MGSRDRAQQLFSHQTWLLCSECLPQEYDTHPQVFEKVSCYCGLCMHFALLCAFLLLLLVVLLYKCTNAKAILQTHTFLYESVLDFFLLFTTTYFKKIMVRERRPHFDFFSNIQILEQEVGAIVSVKKLYRMLCRYFTTYINVLFQYLQQ